MGSFKGDNRKPGRDRRRSIQGIPGARRGPEPLEERTLLSTFVSTPRQVTDAAIAGPVFARGGGHLSELFEASRIGGQALEQTIEAKSPLITFRNGKVGLDVYGDQSVPFDRLTRALGDLGMEITATDSRNQVVEGFVQIDRLGSVAQVGGIRSFTPIFNPKFHSQGSVANQGEQVLAADQARAQFGVDGSGVTVGVISDSVSRAGNGLADSIATGDLPPMSRINVLLDQVVGGSNTDEGRAMMELIHDIAPGADLAFHTGFGVGPVGFAQGIRDLARLAGAQIIVDDVGIANEPIFQPGLISQAVSDVTRVDNAVYFSAAGNSADHGIETGFRGVNTTVTGVGAGRFLDFDPGPGVAATLPVTVNAAGSVVMWWDDPWFTGAADTNLDFFLINDSGAVVASGITQNIGSATPQEFELVPAAGSYQLAIRVTAGPDPSRIRFQEFSADLTVSQQFGNAGNTTYSTSFGQPTWTDAIGVGAVPFFGAPPFANPSPIQSEAFSSIGPALYIFDDAGNRLPSPRLVLKPDISGPDGTNTTFFGSDIAQDADTSPNFFGTSAAAPNVAAIGALMKQLNPSAGLDEIRDAMLTTATPLNGTAAGNFDPKGGYGLVNAVRALDAVDQLRIVASTPADVAVLGSAPSFVELQFSKPVDPSTLQATDLTFPVLPPGVVVSVGEPTVVNSQTVRFPISIEAPAGVEVNGIYAFELANGAIDATDGSDLIGLRRAFTIADVSAPRVANTIFQGRIVVVEFTEAMRASTVSKDTIKLIRTGFTGAFGRPENVIVTDDPRAVFFYDAPNNRAIYDLRGVPQSVMPSDIYALVATDDVRDATGIRLDGNFTGQFPSGDGQPGGAFAQDLGGRLVTPPQVVNFGLTAESDTGISGDRNTVQVRPRFSGFAVAQFPATNVGLQVAVQFIQTHPNGFDLEVGPNGNGFVGTPDLIVTTDENGFFSFEPPINLRDGFHRVRIVVIGEAEFPPLPGKASRTDLSFRVDTTNPLVTANSIPSESRVSNLRNVTLNFADPVSPADPTDPLAVPVQLDFPALDPETATNLGNYSLINLGPDRVLGTADDLDLSRFIENATFVSTSSRTQPTDPYTGRVELTFTDGLPSGRYALVARTQESIYSGIRDAAGNPLDNDPALPGNQSFATFFELQPEAAFITNFTAFSPSAFNPGTLATSGPRDFYETPVAGFTPRAEAPPEFFFIDFSNTLAPRDYSNAIQLIRSADSPGSPSDGDFGLGAGGSTRVDGVTVALINSIPGATIGQPGYLNRLVVRVPAGQVLPADSYRLAIPNTPGEEIRDIFGNIADLEFLGNERPSGEGFEVFMPDGTYRDGLTGDGVGGGSFVTGFVVAPGQRLGADGRVRGNIIYTRPDYQDDPFLAIDDPDGSLARPFPTLLPEAAANLVNGGDLNAASNFGTGFNPNFDRNANGRFDRSAFFEADLNRALGPVVVVALPGTPRPIPGTTETIRENFVIAPSAGTDPSLPQNNASGSVPEQTMLVFQPGAVLKLFNGSLFVQNQGSSLQLRGSDDANGRVIVTSLLDDSVGGDTNNDAGDTTPGGGDWGGIVFRNYDDVSDGRDQLPAQFPVDGKLGLSGASDVLSLIDHATIRYGGGVVPQTIGQRFDSITLFNSRPAITNTTVADSSGGTGGTQAAMSADLDSLREDMIARGPLVRRTEFINNSINGLLIRAPIGSLQAQETDAILYPANPTSEGGGKNFTIDDPVPYVLTSQLVLGQRLLSNTGGQTDTDVSARLYVQPGMMLKSRTGSGIATANTRSSLNIGDRTYIRQFDANPNVAPTDAGFQANAVGDAKPLFTSLSDDDATTFFFDQATGVRRTIVPAGATDNDTTNPQPSAGNITSALRWGSISITPGVVAVVDEAEFRYGGGQVLTPIGSLPNRQVLDLTNDIASFLGYSSGFGSAGANVSVTNNDFFDNFDTPIIVEPDQLLAADPMRPLLSGNPFFRGNVMQRNSINGLGIKTWPGFVRQNVLDDYYSESNTDDAPNLSVDSVWDDTDIVHVLRGTVTLDGWSGFGGKPIPDPNSPEANAQGFLPELKPFITLTIQSALPDSLLASGERVARPGESMYVKLFNDTGIGNPGPGGAVDPDLAQAAGDANNQFGAGFNVGFDDGIDPPAASPFVDPGYGSQLRIVGIGTNETTGQQRVPVVMTSLRDDTAGPVVRGVNLSDTFFSDFEPSRNLSGDALSTPVPGDGGIIAFGGGSLFDYNLYDPRNGSLIDNADIRYIHRIEYQGGGIVDAFDDNASGSIDAPDNVLDAKLGVNPLTQYNAQHAWTVSNSTLSDFRDAGILADQGFDLLARVLNPSDPPTAGGVTRIGGLRGQPTNLFLINNTIANMPVGVRVNYPAGFNNTAQQNPAQVVLLHNTFYNNGVGFRTSAPTYASPPPNSASHVYFIAMNNIFDGGTIGSDPNAAAVRLQGMVALSELLFNNFNNYATVLDNQISQIPGVPFQGNNVPIFGDPRFLDPQNGNFFIQSGSAAIDAALSELGPVTIGDMLYPISDQLLDARGGIRNTIGRNNPNGGLGFFNDHPGELITLPGTPGRNFVDQFITAIPGAPGSSLGPATNIASYAFSPLGGERDKEGFLRLDDPNTPNIGFGSRPFFDVGAREFRVFDPPQVTNVGGEDVDGDGTPEAVFATVVDPATDETQLVNLYSPGTILGLGQAPLDITFQFDERLDPQTVNRETVLLQASGGDGVFGNANSPADRTIPLSGRLVFDPGTRRLTVRLAAANLLLSNDLYRIVLVGSGGNVLRDPQGNALDGENVDANGVPRQLPSGDGFPGGNFILPFTIDTRAPAVVPGTFQVVNATPGLPVGITNDNPPSFTGRITDQFPPVNPLVGQRVTLDIDIDGDGTFDLIGVGTATTDASGTFVISPGQPLDFQTPVDVGPDGMLGTADDTGYSRARIRVSDVSGNASDPNDPSAIIPFVLDTRGPRIIDASPAPGSRVAPSGRFRVSFTADENIALASLRNPGAITAVGAGLDGVFGTADDRAAAIDLATLNIEFLATAPSGPTRVSFDVTGATANDIYRVTVTDSVTDLADNGIDGESTGGFPTGNNIPGGSFTLDVVVFTSGQERRLFVGPQTSANPTGSRTNPFPTIAAGLAAATVGDTVAVLPGTYNEAVTLKSLVRLVSADPSSTDSTIVPGRAQATIIRAPLDPDAPDVTVRGDRLLGTGGDLDTELRGFTIASPLTGLTTGEIQDDSIGLLLTGSGGLFHRNLVINANHGIEATPSGGSSARIENNVLAGNSTGLFVRDAQNVAPIAQPVRVANNTIVLNNGGVVAYDETPNVGNSVIVDVVNNIFWQNNDRTPNAQETHVAVFPPVALVRNNMFSSNPNNALLGFDPAALGTVPNAAAAFNYIGEPAFAAPRDPRPQFDGPTIALLDANFNLTSSSAAIDAADPTAAPTLDALGRTRVDIPNRGFAPFGPADIGAFEFQGGTSGGNGGGGGGGGVFVPPGGGTPTPAPGDGILFGAPASGSTFQAGNTARAQQVAGGGAAGQNAIEARRQREAARRALNGKAAQQEQVVTPGRRAFFNLINRPRPKQG